jgi:hypothetical protein
VGAFASSPSAYGTFDQGGDVFQWNEDTVPGPTYYGRILRGGCFDLPAQFLESGQNGDPVSMDPSATINPGFFSQAGFRVAQVPEPASLGVLILGGVGILSGRRRVWRGEQITGRSRYLVTAQAGRTLCTGSLSSSQASDSGGVEQELGMCPISHAPGPPDPRGQANQSAAVAAQVAKIAFDLFSLPEQLLSKAAYLGRHFEYFDRSFSVDALVMMSQSFARMLSRRDHLVVVGRDLVVQFAVIKVSVGQQISAAVEMFNHSPGHVALRHIQRSDTPLIGHGPVRPDDVKLISFGFLPGATAPFGVGILGMSGDNQRFAIDFPQSQATFGRLADKTFADTHHEVPEIFLARTPTDGGLIRQFSRTTTLCPIAFFTGPTHGTVVGR